MNNKFNILNRKHNNYYTDEENENAGHRKIAILRQHDNLFDDEDHIVHKIISIRRQMGERKGEYWEILEDGEVMLELKGYRFSKKEKQFLRTPEGMGAAMNLYKSGCRSVSKIKRGLF